MTAPKIDTQAPERIDRTTVTDFATGDETTMLTLMIDGKLDYADADGPWGQAVLALLAERDLSAAREAAAAMAMREAAAYLCDRMETRTNSPARCAKLIREIPLPDTTALDRLIAERVREARMDVWDQAMRTVKQYADEWPASAILNDLEAYAERDAARGSKEDRDG